MSAPGLYAKLISTASSGDTTIDTPDAGRQVYVLGYALFGGGANTVKLTSGAAGATIAGPYLFAAGQSIVVPPPALGGVAQEGGSWAQCAVSAALVVNLSGAVQVSGHVLYEIR